MPNAYFSKYVKNKETQQDCSPNTASQGVTSVKQEEHAASECTDEEHAASECTDEEHAASECTDEELMLALSQAEELAATTANTSHGDSSEQISEEGQSVSNLSCDAQHAPEGNDATQSGGEGSNLGRSVTGEEGETNMELSIQTASDDGAVESSTTSLPAEACDDATHSGTRADHENIASVPGQQTWISCTVG